MSDVVPSYLDLEDPFETQVCAKEIADPPPECDFSKFPLNSNSPLSNDLIQRTENLLKVDLDNEIVSEDKLRRLVSTAARLLSEHDLLINSRNKLYESMNKMHHLEKEATMKLYSQLNLQMVDEESRRVIVELSEKLGNLSTPADHDESLSDSMNKNNYVNANTPSPALSHGTKSSYEVKRISPKIFSVPPPDPSRPPPGYTPHRFPSMLYPPIMRPVLYGKRHRH